MKRRNNNMDNLFVIREKMRELYAAHSRVFDKGIQFVLALVTFYLINVMSAL